MITPIDDYNDNDDDRYNDDRWVDGLIRKVIVISDNKNHHDNDNIYMTANI